MRIGIIGAMSVEVEELVSTLEGASTSSFCNLSFHNGKLEGKDVVVVASGVGKVNAAICVQLLVDHFKVDAVINTGIAGAIDERLHIGDFVVATDCVQHDMDATLFGYKPGQVPGMKELSFIADASLIEMALKGYHESGKEWDGQMLKGRIASGDQFISQKERKLAIKETFHPLCVEMEGAAIAQACVLNKIPFSIIRCLSDTADEKSTKGEYEFNEAVMAKRSAMLVKSVIKAIGG